MGYLEMLSAEEVHKTTEYAIIESCEKEIESIMNDIQEAIAQQKYYVSKRGLLSEPIKKYLKSKHYKISTDTQYNESWYTIRW